MPFCQYCGSKLEETDKFCCVCGQQVVSQNTGNEEFNSYQAQIQPTFPPHNGIPPIFSQQDPIQQNYMPSQTNEYNSIQNNDFIHKSPIDNCDVNPIFSQSDHTSQNNPSINFDQRVYDYLKDRGWLEEKQKSEKQGFSFNFNGMRYGYVLLDNQGLPNGNFTLMRELQDLDKSECNFVNEIILQLLPILNTSKLVIIPQKVIFNVNLYVLTMIYSVPKVIINDIPKAFDAAFWDMNEVSQLFFQIYNELNNK